MASEDDVPELALSLVETTEKPSYGMPGFRVKDKLFTTSYYDGYPLVLLRLEQAEREELLDFFRPEQIRQNS